MSVQSASAGVVVLSFSTVHESEMLSPSLPEGGAVVEVRAKLGIDDASVRVVAVKLSTRAAPPSNGPSPSVVAKSPETELNVRMLNWSFVDGTKLLIVDTRRLPSSATDPVTASSPYCVALAS